VRPAHCYRRKNSGNIIIVVVVVVVVVVIIIIIIIVMLICSVRLNVTTAHLMLTFEIRMPVWRNMFSNVYGILSVNLPAIAMATHCSMLGVRQRKK